MSLASLSSHLIPIGLKVVFEIPADKVANFLRDHFTDHSQVLPKAIDRATERAWEAVGLTLAGDSWFGRMKGMLRNGDLEAVRRQLRSLVDSADAGLNLSEAEREKATAELTDLRKRHRLDPPPFDDLRRFINTAGMSDDATSAIRQTATGLLAEAPTLARVLNFVPASGGMPLLLAAFAFFLRREVANDEKLSRELTHDRLTQLNDGQVRVFGMFENLFDHLSDGFAMTHDKLTDIQRQLRELKNQHHIHSDATKPREVSITTQNVLDRLKPLIEAMKKLPSGLIRSGEWNEMGDVLAAAGMFPQAADSHQAASKKAQREADETALAESQYKLYLDLCEQQKWPEALMALREAIVRNSDRFRPCPEHFEILGILGAGAFGTVLLCRDHTDFDENDQPTQVAVKTLRNATFDRDLSEILAEANLLKRLTHPNIIGVRGTGFTNFARKERPWVALEYFPGRTLEEHIEQTGPLPLKDFVPIFQAVAEALHAAHTSRRPILHRDLKPSNIMVQSINGFWTVKVIDFGLAMRANELQKSINVPNALRDTRNRSISGTIKFGAPEQLGELNAPVGPYSDVYAFGKTALESMFRTTEPKSRHWNLLPAEFRSPFQEMLERCTESELGEGLRYQNFGPVLEELKRFGMMLTGNQSKGEERGETKPVLPPVNLFSDVPGTLPQVSLFSEPPGMPKTPAEVEPAPKPESPLAKRKPHPFFGKLFQKPETASTGVTESKIEPVAQIKPKGPEWDIPIPGILLKRPAEDEAAEWVEVCKTPAKVNVLAEEVYQFLLPDEAVDSELVSLTRSNVPPSLQALDLSDCAQITDEGLAHVVNLHNLQELFLDNCENITDKALIRIATLSKLETLSLQGCTMFSDEGLGYIAALSNLRDLTLFDCVQITNKGLIAVAKLDFPRKSGHTVKDYRDCS